MSPTTGSPNAMTKADVCITSDIPLASRCLAKGGRALAPNGKIWTPDNIGNALAGREVGRYLREMGLNTGGPAPLTKQDRSQLPERLDTLVRAAQREQVRMTDKVLGVLGGMGPLASAQFMVRLTLLTPAERDQDHIPAVLWSDPRVPDRNAARLWQRPRSAALADARHRRPSSRRLRCHRHPLQHRPWLVRADGAACRHPGPAHCRCRRGRPAAHRHRQAASSA